MILSGTTSGLLKLQQDSTRRTVRAFESDSAQKQRLLTLELYSVALGRYSEPFGRLSRLCRRTLTQSARRRQKEGGRGLLPCLAPPGAHQGPVLLPRQQRGRASPPHLLPRPRRLSISRRSSSSSRRTKSTRRNARPPQLRPSLETLMHGVAT